MTNRDVAAPDAGLLARAPSCGLVLGAIAAVQFGSALAATLFARLGPGGAVFLRLVFGSLLLLAIWRPRFARDHVARRGAGLRVRSGARRP